VDRGVRPTTTARACGVRRFLGAVLGRWTNRMIIETRPSARHSPFGAFQHPGCAVELRMGSFSANSTPALGRQLNRRPDRPPLFTGWESCTSPAAEPASCYLLDHGNGPGGQGGLEPAAASGGLVFAEGSRHQVQKGHGGSLRLPTRSPSGPSSRSSLPVITRPTGRPALARGGSDTPGPARTRAASAARPRPERDLKVELAQQAGSGVAADGRGWSPGRRAAGQVWSAAQPSGAAA
jgi:hypothetical protein